MTDFSLLLIAAMDEFGITSAETRAGIAAICMGETGFRPVTEQGYSHTPNDRIRKIFGDRVRTLTEDQLTALKASDENFFNWVYGGQWGAYQLGNILAGDGFKYRGRGFDEITGLGNYTRYGKRLGVDLVNNPDLANDPTTSARLAAAYVADRYHGGGWEALKRCVGTAVASTEAVKGAAYARFLASGEFGGSPPGMTPESETDRLNAASLAAAEKQDGSA